MERRMRRFRQELPDMESRRILAAGKYAVWAVYGDDDYPYAVPVNYVVINKIIYIHGTCESGQKSENIKKNPKVCFTVIGNTEVLPSRFSENYESVVVLGKAHISDEFDKRIALEEFINKYSNDYKEAGMKYIDAAKDKVSIYKISIDKITGKSRR